MQREGLFKTLYFFVPVCSFSFSSKEYKPITHYNTFSLVLSAGWLVQWHAWSSLWHLLYVTNHVVQTWLTQKQLSFTICICCVKYWQGISDWIKKKLTTAPIIFKENVSGVPVCAGFSSVRQLCNKNAETENTPNHLENRKALWFLTIVQKLFFIKHSLIIEINCQLLWNDIWQNPITGLSSGGQNKVWLWCNDACTTQVPWLKCQKTKQFHFWRLREL